MSTKHTKTLNDILTDVWDIRDLMARYEEIEDTTEPDEDTPTDNDGWALWEERTAIRSILDEVCGNGGDEQWRGDWYPVGFVADSYFETYAQELAEDIGAIKRDASWPNNHIDWNAAAEALKEDYQSIEIDGQGIYWYR